MNNKSIHNAEVQLLCHLIADNDLYWQFCPRLKDEFFTEFQYAWLGYKKVISEGGRVNLISLSTEVGQGYFDTLTNLTTEIKYDVDFETWINFMEVEVKRQKGLKILSRLNEIIQNERIDEIENILQESLNDLSGENFEHKDMIDHVKDIINHIENIQTGKRVTGHPTGISVYDNFTGGLHNTDLTIIAAETSQGKTTLALNMIHHTAKIGNYVGMFSLEMSLMQLTARLTAIDTNTSSKDILRGTANIGRLKEKLGSILNNKILLDNTKNSNLENIISKMRYFIARYGCKLFFIDYLQLINYHKKGNSTEQNLADICRTLKNFAKENDISIVLLCQLNRDNGGSSEPKLSRLRGSGQIEEAADNVLFVVRPTPDPIGDPENARLIQQKGRNSGLCECDIVFVGQIPSFQNR